MLTPYIQKRKIVLSSRSPRRREMLTRAGLHIEIHPGSVDESAIPAKTPREFALKAALLKANDVAHHYADALIIAADTIVVLDNVILGKPRDEAEARAMLIQLSGRTHQVITGVAVKDTLRGHTALDAVTTAVTFHTLSRGQIDEYIASGDPMDKAGAYGIQNIGDSFVEGIDGDYDNVVGLPMAKVMEMLDMLSVESQGKG